MGIPPIYSLCNIFPYSLLRASKTVRQAYVGPPSSPGSMSGSRIDRGNDFLGFRVQGWGF